MTIRPIDGGHLLSVPGLSAAVEATGVKPSGHSDLAIIVADEPMNAVGMFTTNTMAAPPVVLTRAKLAKNPTIKSLVINSGNANALTGPRGRDDAGSMVASLEEACGGPGVVLSTGVIGTPLPLTSIERGIERAAKSLSPHAGPDLAEAILTTDTFPKTVAVQVEVSGRTYTVGGVAKGSGMIHPNLATMLAVVATDAPIEADALREILARSVDRSFHEITVDGDCSTNDAVLLLARKPADDRLSVHDEAKVADAIEQVCAALSRLVVEDGEGVTRLLTINVLGAPNDEDARAIAHQVALSPLVKTALAGGDPQWGRIAAAVGNSGVEVSPSDLGLTIAGLTVFEAGAPVTVSVDQLTQRFREKAVTVDIRVGSGPGRFHIVTTDLSKRYVEINADYTT
jgi:glutamate N-acetyltransferase/amino-acid N-acetyltransferase